MKSEHRAEQVAPISIVLPTYNRLKTLRQVWPSYLGQAGVREIIVVDDGGTDGTQAFIKAQQKQDARIRYIRNETNYGQPTARNIGAEHATGDFILYGEDDLRFEPDYGIRLLACLERTGGAIAGGRLVYPFPGESDEDALARTAQPPTERIDPYGIAFDASAPAPGPIEVPFIHACTLVRRDVFEHVRYDPIYKGNAYREETDFYLQAVKSGFRIYFCPDALCFHLPREVQQLGGAMAKGIWVHKYWSLRNNYIFLRRHYQFLQQQNVVKGGLLITHLRFVVAELKKIPSFYLRRYSPALYTALARQFSK